MGRFYSDFFQFLNTALKKETFGPLNIYIYTFQRDPGINISFSLTWTETFSVTVAHDF